MSLTCVGKQPQLFGEKEKIQLLVSENFKIATQEDYVHYVLKNRFNKTTYELNFLPKTQEIEKTTGKPVALDSKRVNYLTPMHVGAIVNNLEGVKFLLGQRVRPDELDGFGNTPYDYCKMFSHTELALLLKPGQKLKESISANDRVIDKLLAKWKVDVPEVPFVYKSRTHDFGVEIKRLLFTRPSFGKSENGLEIRHLAGNMEKIAKIEGINLEFTYTNIFPRDHIILLPNGYKHTGYSESVMKAIERKSSYELIHNSSSTDYAFIAMETTGGATIGESIAKFEFALRFREQKEKGLPFYIEGGNYFILSNFKCEQKMLMGEGVLLLVLNQLILDGFFRNNEDKTIEYAKGFKKSLTEKDLLTALEEMYSQGLLKQSENCPKGLISLDERSKINGYQLAYSQHSGEFNNTSYLNQAISFGCYKPMNLSSKMVEDSREMVSRYLARKEATKDLIAESFSIQKNALHFIPQLDYHLDVFIHSGPCGSLFVQDYEMTKNLLETIKGNAQALGLTKNDLKKLEQYLKTANKLAGHFKPIQKQAVEKLKQAGFIVIPTPGIFYDECPPSFFDETLPPVEMKNMNFLNAVSGWSSKTNHVYWITSGATTGDRLGAVLMDCFKEFIKSYQKDIAVYYVGNDPDNPTDYSEAMKFLNRPSSAAGVHCMSVELETESH